MKVAIKYLLCTVLLILTGTIVCAAGDRRLSVDDYCDKVRAAWLGKMIGVGWGITTEFRYSHRIVPDSLLPPWRPERINEGYNQDDLYLSLMQLYLFDRYGIDVDGRTACLERINLQTEYGGAALQTLVCESRIAPPDTGHPRYKPTSDGCGYTCGADFSGIIAPGLPQSAVYCAERLGSIISYGDGLYGGVFVGAMYCEAFFTQDVERIIEVALRSIPAESLVARAVGDVLTWHRFDSIDWRATWQKIMDKYWWNVDNNWIEWPYGGARQGINLDSKSMVALTSLALLYGDGDLSRTLTIAVQASEDSDCNASIAAGVLCASRGTRFIDTCYTNALDRERRFKYFDTTLDELDALTLHVAREAVPRFGGRFEVCDGKEYIEVPAKSCDNRSSRYISSRNPDSLSGVHFTEEELCCVERLADCGFENESRSWSLFSNYRINHQTPVENDSRFERYEQNAARTGMGNVLLSLCYSEGYPRANSKLETGVRQIVRVDSVSNYRLGCWVETLEGDFAQRGFVRVMSLDGREMARVGFGNKPQWTQVGVRFRTAGEQYVVVETGLRAANGHRMAMRVDDFSLKKIYNQKEQSMTNK